jgi:deoxyribose-phosphate aldolase
MERSELNLAEYIDHSLLVAIATPEQVAQACAEADRYNFASVCLFPCHIRQAVDLLHAKQPQVCAVIGFPSGATTAQTKLYEAQEAVENGATELDVVINLGWLKAGKTEEVHREIAQICEGTGQPVKAILEMAVLTEEEKKLAAEICLDAGVAYLKTSTGWIGGCTVEDVQLLRAVAGDRIGVKAAGGIRTVEQAIALIDAGATRLGTSYGIALMQQWQAGG